MDFKLPDIGEGVHEGEIVRWLVKEGDAVSVDQPLVEVMTDKATVEIPTSYAGKVTKLLAKEGEMIKVGQTILTLDEGGASAQVAPPKQAVASAAPAPLAKATVAPSQRQAPVQAALQRQALAASQAVHASPQTSSHVASPGATLATPATRRLARDLGVDLTSIPASGPHGRVTKEDVQRFAGAVAAGPQMPAQARGPVPSAPRPLAPSGGETLIPFRGVRRKISEAMVKSRSTIPEFTYVDECDVTELVAFRKEAKALAEKEGAKLTYMPFITKAVIRALKEFPNMNATLDEAGGNIIVKHYYNIGIAVDTDDGLVVPVIKNADQKSILQLAREMQELAEKARARKLALDDMQGGTFTITNSGNIGGLMATPVINWPEVAILGVHKIAKRPVVKDDQIVVADMMWLSTAVDHRVVDGAMAARFMNVVLEYLSSPKKMMLDMS